MLSFCGGTWDAVNKDKAIKTSLFSMNKSEAHFVVYEIIWEYLGQA